MLLTTNLCDPPAYEESCEPSSPSSSKFCSRSARYSRSYYVPSPRLLIPTSPLPAYNKLPSLDPWLDLFPASPTTPTSSISSKSPANNYLCAPHAKLSSCNLSLFLASHKDDWPDLLLSLTSKLSSFGLVRDPHANIRVLLWPETEDTTQRIARDASWLPEELRNTALWMTQEHANARAARELGLDISSVLRNTLFAHVNHRTSRRNGSPLTPAPIITPDLLRQQACIPKDILGLIYHAGLSQAEFEHFLHVFYLLQCRQMFVAAARAQITAVEQAHGRVGPLKPRPIERVVSRIVVGIRRRWSTGQVNKRA